MQGLRILTRSGAAPTSDEIVAAQIVANTHKEMTFGTIYQTEPTHGVEVEYHAGKNMAFVSSGIPYYAFSSPSTPYDIDSMSISTDSDSLYSMEFTTTAVATSGGGCAFGDSKWAYIWSLVDVDTGAVHSSGTGEQYRCYTSCGGGGCSFTGYAVNVPFSDAGGGTSSPTSTSGSTSGCSSLTCFGIEHYYYRGNEAWYKASNTRVTTTLQGVIAEAPYLSISLIQPWDGGGYVIGTARKLLYNYSPIWTANILSAYFDDAGGSNLGPSSLAFSVPDRVAYVTTPVTAGATDTLKQRRRDMALSDWASLKVALENGNPQPKFIQSFVVGVPSNEAIRENRISVSETVVVVTALETNVTVEYSYTPPQGGVAGVLRGSKNTSPEPVTKRRTVNRVNFDQFISGTIEYFGNYLRLPAATNPTVSADNNITPWKRPAFLLDYWKNSRLIARKPGDAEPTAYEATANTPGVVADVILFSPVVDGRPIGPLRVLDFPVVTLAAVTPTDIAVHGIMRVKYDSEIGQFAFVRWTSLGDFIAPIPSGVKIARGISALIKYSGYRWADIVESAKEQQIEPQPPAAPAIVDEYHARVFILDAVKAAKEA